MPSRTTQQTPRGQQALLENRASQPLINIKSDHTSAVADVEALGSESQTERMERDREDKNPGRSRLINKRHQNYERETQKSYGYAPNYILSKCQSRTSRIHFGSAVSKNSSQV